MTTATTWVQTDRRSLLRAAILMVGGLAVAPDLACAAGPAFFGAAERSNLDLLCETLIPRTDTPGAVDAGVPAFLDGLMANWASPEHQAAFRGTLGRLAQAAQADTGKPLAALSPAERTRWFQAQDAALLGAEDPGYRQFRRLVLTGYYFSEAGATQELRYELIPGSWDPAVPVTADTRAWAA
jgi:gluconate 2-dehydrogenase gamma chain